MPTVPGPASKLARAAAGQAPQPPAVSAFQKAIAGARPFVPFQIPRLGLDVHVTLVPCNEQERIEGEVFERMRELKLQLNETTEATYEAARACRALAVAIVDPQTHEPIGTVADWSALDADIVGACWRKLADVRLAYDPISTPLTPEELREIADAVKKKDPILLRYFGVARLASYLLTTADQPASSATPTSGASGSSPES